MPDDAKPSMVKTGDASVGRRVARLRGERTQDWLVARMTAISGRTYRRPWLSGVENGWRTLQPEHAVVMARALGVTTDELYGMPAARTSTPLAKLAAQYEGRIADADLELVRGLLERLAGGR